jgi:hypothetical protein
MEYVPYFSMVWHGYGTVVEPYVAIPTHFYVYIDCFLYMVCKIYEVLTSTDCGNALRPKTPGIVSFIST